MRLAGTSFRDRVGEHNLRALDAAFGGKLLGPFTKGKDSLFEEAPRYYELRATVDGRRVHTVFDLDGAAHRAEYVTDVWVADCSFKGAGLPGC